MTDYGHDLRFGTFVTPLAADPQRPVALARATETAGLDLVTYQDHPYQPRFLDTWTLLSYAAAVTERVELAANVVNLPLRPPAVLARSAATLDLLSGGRLALGLGAGAFWDPVVAMGGPRRSPGEAVAALEEAIAVLRALWDTGDRSPVRIEGEHYQVVGAKRGPAPAHPIPLWIGALKPRMLQLVGREADGWLPSMSYIGDPARFGELNGWVDRGAASVGRDPAAVRRMLNLGPADADPAFLAGLALRHGISVFVLAADDEATITRYARETAPRVRDLVVAGRR